MGKKWKTMDRNFRDLSTRVDEPTVQLQTELLMQTKEEIAQKVSAEFDVKALLQEAQSNAERLNDLVEREEKQRIRRNIINRGVLPVEITEGNVLDGVNRYISDLFGIDESVESAFLSGKGSGANRVKITLKSLDIKRIILKEKSSYLKGTKTYIQNELTAKEARIAKKIRDLAKEKRALKIDVKVAGANIFFDDKWWTWNDRSQQLSPSKQIPPRTNPNPAAEQQSSHHSPMDTASTQPRRTLPKNG